MNTHPADALLSTLLARELISRSSAVDGNVVIIFDAAAANFRILDKGRAQLFAHRGDAFARALVVAELVRDDPQLTALRAFLPEIAHIDHDERLLVLRIAGGANDVIEHHRSAPRPAAWLPPFLGYWLAAWHTVAADAALPGDLPPSLLDGGALARNAPAITHALTQAAAGWQSRAVIHGNIDFEHVFITSEAERAIQLAGWDQARIGDPAWDAGAIIESFYAWALDPAIVSVVDGPVCVVGPDLQMLIASFWTAYATAAALTDARAFLLRAFTYAGARMVARINRKLNKPDELEAVTPMVQAAVAMLATPGAVADLFIPPPPVRPQMWGP